MARSADEMKAAARRGGFARAEALDPLRRRKIALQGASLGGHARAKALTKRQRQDQARHAARARWAKRETPVTP